MGAQNQQSPHYWFNLSEVSVQGRRWFDGANTYHAATVTLKTCVDGVPYDHVLQSDITYGYGHAYERTAMGLIREWLSSRLAPIAMPSEGVSLHRWARYCQVKVDSGYEDVKTKGALLS